LDLSALEAKNPALVKEVRALIAHAPPGVKKGPERVDEVAFLHDNLSAEAAYQILDPASFEREVEDVYMKRANLLTVLRNIASILPLIVTWLALFAASNNFVAYNHTHTFTDTTPPSFFELWQGGFGQGFLASFPFAAGLDVALLTTYLILTVLVQRSEQRAQNLATKYSRDVQNVTTKLVLYIAEQGRILVPPGADPATMAAAVQRACDRAIEASEKITKQGQQAVADAEQRVRDLVTSLSGKLDALQQQVTTLATASTGLSTAAGTLEKSTTALATNTNSYIQAGQTIQSQISQLNQNEQALVQRLDTISGSVSGAGTAMNSAAQSVTTLTGKIHTEMTSSVQQMASTVSQAAQSVGGQIQQGAQYLTRADQSLNDTQKELYEAAQELGRAARTIEGAANLFDQVLQAAGVSGGAHLGGRRGGVPVGGLIGSLFARGPRRKP
jgi:hypothetical protein